MAGTARVTGQAFTERTPRIASARALTRRSNRDRRRVFLAEGQRAVREALTRPVVREVFGTDTALARYPDIVERAAERGVPTSAVTERGMAGLTETVTPQNVVAVCDFLDVPLAGALTGAGLVAVLVGVGEPGNAGTVLRSADAAGADAVVFAGQGVDPYNGKCVRASAGSLFHLAVARVAEPVDALTGARRAGLAVLAATGAGEADLFDLTGTGALAGPTAWVFGNEARGLPDELASLADQRVRVPMFGPAESLNLAAAAVVCLYASAAARNRD